MNWFGCVYIKRTRTWLAISWRDMIREEEKKKMGFTMRCVWSGELV